MKSPMSRKLNSDMSPNAQSCAEIIEERKGGSAKRELSP